MKHITNKVNETVTAQAPLGQLLVRRGVLTDEQLATALEQQRVNEERKLIGEVLVDMGFVDFQNCN